MVNKLLRIKKVTGVYVETVSDSIELIEPI